MENNDDILMMATVDQTFSEIKMLISCAEALNNNKMRNTIIKKFFLTYEQYERIKTGCVLTSDISDCIAKYYLKVFDIQLTNSQ